MKEAEEKAIGGGMVLEIGAGGILSQAIRQAQDAYANSLQLTVDKLSGEEQQTLASLTSAVNDFVNKTSASMSALEDKAKAIIHQLPFTKNYPHVVSYLPQYVSKQDFNDDGTIRVRLDGDFIDVTRPRYTMLIHHQSLIVRCQCLLIIHTNDWLHHALKVLPPPAAHHVADL